MYKSFTVKNFRLFGDLKISDLKRVNLIAGVNNVGKTALLEALFLHCGATNPELTFTLDALRGIGSVKVELRPQAHPPWDSIFKGFDTSKEVRLVGQDDQSGRRVLQLRTVRDPDALRAIEAPVGESLETAPAPLPSAEAVHVLELEDQGDAAARKYHLLLGPRGIRAQPIPPPPPFPAHFEGARMSLNPPQLAERFGNLQLRGQEHVLFDALRFIEPRLTRLVMVVRGESPLLHGDIGTGLLIPLPFMGGGMVRLATLILSIANAEGGVVLIDEIENGLHHSALPNVWRAVADAAEQVNAQVFATTHSRECILAAHRAFSERDSYDFRLHRLEVVDGAVRALTLDQEALEGAIDMGLEIR